MGSQIPLVSERIRHRKELLKRRREALSLATDALNQDIAAEAITEQELLRERCALSFYVRMLSVTPSAESQPWLFNAAFCPFGPP